MIHENIELTGSFVVSGSFVLPNHPISSSVNALTGSIYHDTTDNIVKVYNGSQWVTVGEQTAPSSGPASANIEYLVIAGGGSGGGGAAGSGGAGGAGGYLSSSLSSVSSGSSFTITVGAGSATAALNTKGGAGSDSTIAGSSISTITANGGGLGGYDSSNAGGDGGSGGGGSTNNGSFSTGGSGTVGQGNDGGDGASLSSVQWAAGGGGGAGTAGETAEGNNNAGEGGSGLTSKITGTGVERAGGGGGGAWNSGNHGTATGGGGNGGAGSLVAGTAGTANTGGGGGGGGQDGAGGTGGSGVAIFAYPTASISATGGVRRFFNNRVAHIFESSGTFSVSGTKTYNHNTLDIFGDSSCIALYNFNGNANDTGGNYNGTASNITYNQGYINDGAVFNGSSSVITLPSTLSDGSTTDATCISFWFNVGAEVTSATSNNEIMNFAQSSGNFGKIALGSTTGNFGSETFSVTSDVTSQYTYSTTNIPAGWNHAVVQWNSSTTKWDIYINSSQHSTSTFGTNEQGKWALKFGNRSSFYYSGKLDQIRIFSKTLSTAEITTLYEE